MAANHHMRLALDQVSDAVVIVEGGPLANPGPRVLYANEAMSEATGVPVHGLWNLPLGALCDGDMLLELLNTLSGSSGEAVEASAPLNHLQGQPTPCRWSVRRVHDGQGQTLNYILTATPDLAAAGLLAPVVEVADVVQRTVATEPPALQDYQQDLVETIRDTARYVAHEFNNALTAILLPVQLAIRQVPGSGELHSNLQDAYESARKAADLAKDFLDCFRPRPAQRERCRLGSLLGRAMRLATCAQNVTWTLEAPDDLLDVDADSNQIERVIFNLVRNACQAMPGGGRILVKACNTAVSAAEGHALTPGNYVHISVRDWGPGISEEHLPHLFHSCFTTKKDGNGCGLPICYQIVRDHGGDIYVKSRPQVGTAFLLFLPAAVPAAVPAADGVESRRAAPTATVPLPATTLIPPLVPFPVSDLPSDEAAEPIPALSPATNLPALLVVDDEDGVRGAFFKIGRARGYDVTTAATSEEGLQHYRERLMARRPYDGVVLDINLRGGMNGMEVFQAMQRFGVEIPVIATSGQCSESDVKQFEDLGFAGFLPKPFTIEQFDEVIQEVLPA